MTGSPAEDGTVARPVPFISRVRLKNYKSIAECDVRLGPLTILVGPNGSGKSNFVDALAFLSRAVATTPAEAIESRGGLSPRTRAKRTPSASRSTRGCCGDRSPISWWMPAMRSRLVLPPGADRARARSCARSVNCGGTTSHGAFACSTAMPRSGRRTRLMTPRTSNRTDSIPLPRVSSRGMRHCSHS